MAGKFELLRRELGLSAVDLYRALQIEKEALLERSPALGFVPNLGQRKFFNAYKVRNSTDRGIPYIGVFGSGNGVGKTCSLAITACGLAFGSECLGESLRGLYLWDWSERIRFNESRPLRGRIICHPDSMKPNGPVYTEITKWFPRGRYKLNKMGKTYYSDIRCYDDNGNLVCTIDVKSHEQEKGAHAGSNLDFVLFDEPVPEHLYGETVGRTRNGGIMMFFLTPLETSGWMIKQIIDDCDGEHKVLVTASIWDNCKDIDGTNGHLSRSSIEDMIREWDRMNPMELEARINGTFTHQAGNIYTKWNDDVHVVDAFKLPEDWPAYMVIDPHDSRPPAVGWFVQGPTSMYCVAEYPTQDYTHMGPTGLTISEHVAEMRRIEQKMGLHVVYRYGDPNKLSYPYPNTQMTVQQEYAKNGMMIVPSDDNLPVGHGKVNELLYYDSDRPLSVWNVPRLQVFRDCSNIRQSLKNYGLKKNANPSGSLSSRLDPKYKDFADVVRYFAVKLRPFAPVNGSSSYIQSLNINRPM